MSVAASAVGLTASQRANAAIIERVLGARNIPKEIIAAAIVNAKAESGLNPNAVGDSGASVGLFQLHERGAGKGMSVADRKDPVKNTERIAQEYASKWGSSLRSAYSRGVRDVGEFAALWSRYIERPKDMQGAMDYRRAQAAKLFPGQVGAVVAGVATGWVIAALAAVAVVGIQVAKRRRAG